MPRRPLPSLGQPKTKPARLESIPEKQTAGTIVPFPVTRYPATGGGLLPMIVSREREPHPVSGVFKNRKWPPKERERERDTET